MIAILHISSFLQCNLWGKSVYKKLLFKAGDFVSVCSYEWRKCENFPFYPPQKKKKTKNKEGYTP